MRKFVVLGLLIFFVPLGVFADRFCFVDFIDPTYHALLWLHVRLPLILVSLSLVSAAFAALRFTRIQGQLRALVALRSSPPAHVEDAFFSAAAYAGSHPLKLVYIAVPIPFCFTVFGGRIVVSRGLLDLLEPVELALIARHESLHVKARDPLKALLWHLVFAALIVPGFEPLEEVLYQRREREVDRRVNRAAPATYDRLLRRFRGAMCRATPGASFRSIHPIAAGTVARALLPVSVPAMLLLLLAASHIAFIDNLAYLQLHHC